MKVFVTINGLNSIAGGYVILALGFYQSDDIPKSLLCLIQSINYSEINNFKIYEQLLEYSDYFYYEYDSVILYKEDSISQSLDIKNIAQRLALSVNYKLLKYTPTEYIYYKDIPKPIDFKVTYVQNYSKPYSELYLAHLLAYYIRLKNLQLLEYQYPKFSFTKHKGKKTANHFEEIIKHKLTPYHHPDTLELIARYIQKYINKYHHEQMLKHQRFFKKLPKWWQTAAPDKVTLKDYFTKEELEEINKSLSWCRRYKQFKHSDRNIYFPQQKKLPYKFSKWLNNN